MPQQRIRIQQSGPWSALRATIIPVVNTYTEDASRLAKAFPMESTLIQTLGNGKQQTLKHKCSDAHVLETIVSLLAEIAAEPSGDMAQKCWPDRWFQKTFAVAPDLCLAVMTAARKKWIGHDSLHARLWRFMAGRSIIRDIPGNPKSAATKRIWDVQDQEVALAFEKETGISAPTETVRTARRKLVADIQKGKELKFL